jgi:hypothetical protein
MLPTRRHNWTSNIDIIWLVVLTILNNISQWEELFHTLLVGGFNPSEKYESQLG